MAVLIAPELCAACATLLADRPDVAVCKYISCRRPPVRCRCWSPNARTARQTISRVREFTCADHLARERADRARNTAAHKGR